jgi:hypothetical protein
LNQERTAPASKPSLDERAFQQLLCAAYTLQQRHYQVSDAAKHSSFKPIIASDLPDTFLNAAFELTLPGIEANAKQQEQTKLSPDRIAPLGSLRVHKTTFTIARRGPKIWRTVEALAIGTVFCCFMVSASVPWFSTHAGGGMALSSPAALPKGEVIQRAVRLSSKAIDESENLKSSRHSQGSMIARDTVVRYMNLPSVPHVQAGISGGGSQTSGPKRSGFARESDMIASDTVLRYDKDFSSSRKPATGKALPIIPESLRSSAR